MADSFTVHAAEPLLVQSCRYFSPNRAKPAISLIKSPLKGKDEIFVSPISPISSSGPFCRICHEGDGHEELVKPCRCSGSMGLVHRSCLEKWLSSANSNSCEICHYAFATLRRPKRFMEWMNSASSPEDFRNLLGDGLCFLLLTPLATVSSYLCFMGAKHYSSWSTKWEASGLIALCVILVSIYFTWCFITLRYHYRVWVSWRQTHQTVHLQHMTMSAANSFTNISNDHINNNNNVFEMNVLPSDYHPMPT